MNELNGPAPLLEAKGVVVRFGGITALNEVSITVPPSSLIGLVGPNGAGKSTMFAVCSGLQRPNRGRVYLMGEDVTEASPQVRARLGLARTFQHPEMFFGLTVREHLVLAYRVRSARSRLWKDMFDAGGFRRPRSPEKEYVDMLLELLSLQDVADSLVDALPLGITRQVEVGRALANGPQVVLLDEPLSGLDANETSRLAASLDRIVKKWGTSLLLVEHDISTVLRLCSHIFVLDFGQLIAEGPPEAIRTNTSVKSAYLGDTPVEGHTHMGVETGPAPKASAATVEFKGMPEDPILRITDLDVRYGPARALFGVSFDLPRGSMVALLGPNGAGKSTLGRAISGLISVASGRIEFEGQDITSWPAHRRRRAGIAYAPEGRGIFPGLSVIDNLKMACRQAGGRSEREAGIQQAIELFPVLGSRQRQVAGSLSGGEQQMLALARALAVGPKVVIADEMSLGLAPLTLEIVFEGIERARRSGIAVVLIEQFIHRALDLSDWCVILSRGEISWSGEASTAGPQVIERYLGEGQVTAT
jgi:ABC-type branched-subunit amino acid transport system ATPase component